MVSKTNNAKPPSTKLPRNPSRSKRSHSNHHRRNRSKKSLPKILFASLNKSISSFSRRFVKFFQHSERSNLWSFRFLFTPKYNNNVNVNESPVSKASPIPNSRRQALLPPMENDRRTTIILDLDETLVHSMHNPPLGQHFDFVIHPIIDDQVMSFYVLKRPGLEKFLSKISSYNQFEIVVFTAGLREYATLVLDEIDREGVISHRLFRDSCKEMNGKLVKDLGDLGRDLGKVVIMDDNPNAYSCQPENAIPMRPFVEDLEDKELLKMMRFFDECLRFGDMRDAVKVFLDDDELAIRKRLGL